jgi:hypothetical protein
MANPSGNESDMFPIVFGILNPSVSIEEFAEIMDLDHSLCIVNTANNKVVRTISCCQEGLDLAMACLNDYSEGAIFPDRKTILAMIGCKSIENLRSAERCLLFREFKSFLILLRTAFASAAMLYFLSKDDTRISKWIQLTQFPGRTLSQDDYKQAEQLERIAWDDYCEVLKISKSMIKGQRQVFNAMVHVNLFGFMVTEDFADESANVPSNLGFTQNILSLLKQQPSVDNPAISDNLPPINMPKIGEAYSAFMLSQVKTLCDTVMKVTDDHGNAERTQQYRLWLILADQYLQ